LKRVGECFNANHTLTGHGRDHFGKSSDALFDLTDFLLCRARIQMALYPAKTQGGIKVPKPSHHIVLRIFCLALLVM
jgi:hypothetical protein